MRTRKCYPFGQNTVFYAMKEIHKEVDIYNSGQDKPPMVKKKKKRESVTLFTQRALRTDWKYPPV